MEIFHDFGWFFVEIFHDFGWFFATRIRIRFIEADPDPADQNETDSNGSGSATLPITVHVVYIVDVLDIEGYWDKDEVVKYMSLAPKNEHGT